MMIMMLVDVFFDDNDNDNDDDDDIDSNNDDVSYLSSYFTY